jgi:integral membrane protein (TIGR00529 family)
MNIPIEPSTLAFLELFLVCGILVVLVRLKIPLWLSVVIGGVVVCLLSGLPPAAWPDVVVGAVTERNYLLLCSMVLLIMCLSSIQDRTGQSRALVDAIEPRLRHPRWRLVLFPALVGLLPMPGGALFSCPMVRLTAEHMHIPEKTKALINYWFRHIWELAWPLYPGYALLCALVGIPLSVFWRFTFPMVFVAMGLGWFFFLRDLRPHETPRPADEERRPRWEVLFLAMPIIVALLGAGVFSLLIDFFWPGVPGQVAFCASLGCAIILALWGGRRNIPANPWGLVFNRTIGRMMLLLTALFCFKQTIVVGGLVERAGHIGAEPLAMVLLFMVLPLLAGVLTGIMVGYVGMTFPFLLGFLLATPALRESFTPLIVLAAVMGNCGQLLSPLHVCLIVTGEYFGTSMSQMWGALWKPTLCLGMAGIALVAILQGIGATF